MGSLDAGGLGFRVSMTREAPAQPCLTAWSAADKVPANTWH